MTEQKRVFLQPTGSVTLNKCILHFLETYNNGYAEQARNAAKVLAITSMLPNVIEKAKEMDKEISNMLDLMDSRQDYVRADAYSITLEKHRYILEKTLEIYEMIMEGLAAAGITQKTLLDHVSNENPNFQW